ncbi:ermin [Lethenteron reissneri]|uniref:ermin n=1 Tax=Lethenteron reissneri TaxID=7753 RepID=UPI002AB68B9A|nr:ermin [Lethenteron reissneri]
MAENNAAETKDADAIITSTNGSSQDGKSSLMEGREETGEDVCEESSQLDGCTPENGVSQTEEARQGDKREADGEKTHADEPASIPPRSEQADQAVAVETGEGETTEAGESPSSDQSVSVQAEEEVVVPPQWDSPSDANRADSAPDAVPPTAKPRSPSIGFPVEARRRDVAKCSYNMYNTVSYRNIRKGNTRQRIDEFESMMYTN